jgi:diguanylate cyclase (GGDEF)-like protein
MGRCFPGIALHRVHARPLLALTIRVSAARGITLIYIKYLNNDSCLESVWRKFCVDHLIPPPKQRQILNSGIWKLPSSTDAVDVDQAPAIRNCYSGAMSLFSITSNVLPLDAEREFTAKLDAELMQLLPTLGPLSGFVVLMFNVWDWLIDPVHAGLTLAVRAALVLIGAPAYLRTRLPWTPTQRCGYIYCTHAGAIVISEYLLKDGFLYGLGGIAACVFAASVVTLRLRNFFLILALPSLMFVVFTAVRMSLFGFINGMMLYVFSVGLAGIVMLVTRFFRQRAFLFEQQLIQISRHDSLTGAYNRGFLMELAEREVALAMRHRRPLAVAMLDIDHFKKVNDNFGHDVGDKVIKLLVQTCKENLRVIDHFGRIGGEEFVCVLPEAAQADVMLCAERLRASVEALHVETPQGELRFTMSIGVALLNSHHADWNALLKDADTALYRAKREGRNRVALST